MKDKIVELVVEQLKSRSELGIKKYGTTLERPDLSLRDWICHAKQEAFDLSLYLERVYQDLGRDKEQYLYTEEDVRKAFSSGFTEGLVYGMNRDYNPMFVDEYINRLKDK